MNGASDIRIDEDECTIKLRVDVDYAYPSRLKSFFCTALGIRVGKGYLKNSKTIAQMINESKKKVKAYWFFTPRTIPDKELLNLLSEQRHEIALHVATNPYQELKLLEQATHRRINYYTVHGTARLLARLMWHRKLSEAKTQVPADFPLQSFYVFPTIDIDWLSFDNAPERVLKNAEKSVAKGEVLHFHPEWLFQRGTMNRRGPFYDTLKKILGVDEELGTLVVRRKGFFRIAQDTQEYRRDLVPTKAFLAKLADRGVDVFTFIERKWCFSLPKTEKSWINVNDNIALLQIKTYENWWEAVGKKTRNMVRKAEKNGVNTLVVGPSEKLAEGIWRIYNETPIRQERAFPHYGISLAGANSIVFSAKEDTFIGAFIGEELVGFIQLVYGDKIAIVQQILSFQRHSDKAVNNALIAKAVEVCALRQVGWLMYARMGNHPSLDNFKENNGFAKFSLPRHYIPLTKKGEIATRVGLHRELKDSLPEALKPSLFPVFNWVSRNKQRFRLWGSKHR